MDCGDKIPSSVKECVDTIVSSLTPTDIEYISKNVSRLTHFGVGMHLRNKWGLWKDNPITKDALALYGISHADDVSGLILEWVLCKAKGEEFDPMQFSKACIKHWENCIGSI